MERRLWVPMRDNIVQLIKPTWKIVRDLRWRHTCPSEGKGDPNMKTLLFATACIVVISGPALACRGTTEFPEVFTQLEQSTISPERMDELIQRLSQGQAMHEEGHSQGDGSKMGAALGILDEIKREIGE